MFNVERSFANLLYQKFIFNKVYAVKAIAPEIDVSPSTLYDYIHGRLTFPPDKIPLLYKATGDWDFIRFFVEDTDLAVIRKLLANASGEQITMQGLTVADLAGQVAAAIKTAMEDQKLEKREKKDIKEHIKPLIHTLMALDKDLNEK